MLGREINECERDRERKCWERKIGNIGECERWKEVVLREIMWCLFFLIENLEKDKGY